jgi:uncharacterized PurR-regulated membrane protein YhhQ (DUF165 family)
MRYLILTLFVLSIAGANWAIATFGIVGVGFGLMAPAGVYFAGLTFTLRDALHEVGGRRWVIAAIIGGAALSGLLAGSQLALASGVAFLLSECADYAVYAPLRRRTWLGAVVASNTVGVVVDSMLFLWLAGFGMAFLPGQIVGKLWMTALAVACILVWQRAAARRAVAP